MNCKPNQLAFIVVPKAYRGSGIEQLTNHVVTTLGLVPGYPEPTWRVSPRQFVVFQFDLRDWSGREHRAGERAWTDCMPDSLLRPFDPKSAPEFDEVAGEPELQL